MISERGMDLEAQTLELSRDLHAASQPIAVKDITSWLQDRHGDEYERKINPKWVGHVLRRKLHLHTARSNQGYALVAEDLIKLTRLYERYGIAGEATDAPPSGGQPADGGPQGQ
jgi:hypothetical protein